MLRSILAFAAIATTTLASGIPGLPECAQACVTNYGGCNQVDVACICENKPLIANLACCVGARCNSGDQQSVISFADALCGSYNADGSLPTAATCAPGAVSTPVTGTNSGSAAATSAATTSAASTEAKTTGTAASSVSSAIASASSASASATTGGAVEYAPQGVGLVLGFIGFLAAL